MGVVASLPIATPIVIRSGELVVISSKANLTLCSVAMFASLSVAFSQWQQGAPWQQGLPRQQGANGQDFGGGGFDGGGFGGQGFGGQGFGGKKVVRSDFPMWKIEAPFQADVFTFARIKYTSIASAGRYGRGNRWQNDFPDSDWNFSCRLQELTSMKVDPNGRVLELTDPELFDYPFLFMNGVGSLQFSREEAASLGQHLLNGGFLMVDDFWGEEEWSRMKEQMKMVFPNREPIDLPLSHELFHIVYDLKTKPQVPDIRTWRSGATFEFNHPLPHGDKLPHFQAYHDDKDRIVALLCHNNDLGDGWEREGENADYFETFSVPFSYPMGINIITYAMTH